ncbi:unnamed protein product, partial [Ectocarpus fasciculatus]
ASLSASLIPISIMFATASFHVVPWWEGGGGGVRECPVYGLELLTLETPHLRGFFAPEQRYRPCRHGLVALHPPKPSHRLLRCRWQVGPPLFVSMAVLLSV